MATVAQLIAERLQEAGIRHAFGIPGGEVLSLVDALQETGIRFVLVKHENCGGFMAEGVHQRTGAPALLLTTVGPGLANAVNVVANAQQDRVPLILLTGCIEPAAAQTYTHQWFDQSALMRPITKACFVAEPDAADVMIDKAVRYKTGAFTMVCAISGDGKSPALERAEGELGDDFVAH